MTDKMLVVSCLIGIPLTLLTLIVVSLVVGVQGCCTETQAYDLLGSIPPEPKCKGGACKVLPLPPVLKKLRERSIISRRPRDYCMGIAIVNKTVEVRFYNTKKESYPLFTLYFKNRASAKQHLELLIKIIDEAPHTH